MDREWNSKVSIISSAMAMTRGMNHSRFWFPAASSLLDSYNARSVEMDVGIAHRDVTAANCLDR
jgi:hypothetical protein